MTMHNYNTERRFIKARRADLYSIKWGRNANIRGVFIHSTRSGRSAGDDGPGTENWANHPDNGGAFWDALIFENGQQVKCTNWERDEHPLWAAGFGAAGTWSAQDNYIHIEIAQGQATDPFTPESLESAAQWVAELATVYKFPIGRIPFLAQTGAAPYGIADHENSANGKKLGKSDPGRMFPWAQFIARANEIQARGTNEKEEEPQMKDEEIRAIVREEMERREDDAAKRLNYAIQLRNRISAIALEPDIAIVEQAAGALRGVGFKL